MTPYAILVWAFVLLGILSTWFFFRGDRRPSTLSIGVGVTGWVLDSQSGFDYLAYGLQGLSAIIAILFVLPREPRTSLGVLAKSLTMLQRFSYVFIASQVVALAVAGSGAEGLIRAVLLSILIATFNSYSNNLSDSLQLPLVISSIASLTIFMDALLSITQVSLTEIGGGRAGGVIGHPNYAAYLSAAACVVWYLKKQTLASMSAMALTGLATIFTLSRTAILALFLALLIVSIQKRKVAQASVLAILTALIALAQSNLAATIFDRFGWILSSGGLLGANSSGWRALQWATTVETIWEKQFLPVGWKQSGQYLLSGLEPHNYYLQSLLELGFLGLIVATGFTFIFLRAQVALQNLGPFAIFGLGSFLDAGLLVPSFFVGCLLMLLASGVEATRSNSNTLPKKSLIHPAGGQGQRTNLLSRESV